MNRKAFVKLLMTTQIWGGVASGQLVPGVEPVLPEGGPVETLPSPERVEALEQGDFLGDGISKIILERAGVVGISREFDGLAVGVGVDLPSPATLARRIRPYLEGGLWMSELEAIADEILAHYDAEGFPVMLLDVPEQDFGSGVVRVLVEETVPDPDAPALLAAHRVEDLRADPSPLHESGRIFVAQDRLTINAGAEGRFREAVETALHFGKGEVHLFRDAGEGRFLPAGHHSRGLHSPATGRVFRPASPALFSFNSPLGACPRCRGFGRIIELDTRLAIPDQSLSIEDGAIRCWES